MTRSGLRVLSGKDIQVGSGRHSTEVNTLTTETWPMGLGIGEFLYHIRCIFCSNSFVSPKMTPPKGGCKIDSIKTSPETVKPDTSQRPETETTKPLMSLSEQ